MQQLEYANGAMYLLFTDTLQLLPQPITSAHGFTIYVGDKVNRIGKIVRTMFSLKEGLYMEYEGVLMMGAYKVAIFNCPAHNEDMQQASLFNKPVQYRYAFNMVEVMDVFHCFIVGSHKGCRDIVMDDLKLIEQCHCGGTIKTTCGDNRAFKECTTCFKEQF